VIEPAMFTEALDPNPDIVGRTAENAGEAWVHAARRWLERYLTENPYLRPDDAKRNGCPVPPTGEWRAFGSIIRHALKHGLMVRAGEAPRGSGHGAMAPRYRSLIFRGNPRVGGSV